MNKKQKHLVFTVVNDLTYDQRMQRICTSLANAGYRVTLIGRLLPESKPLASQNFAQKRLRVGFRKGKMFYIAYNLRLFWHLLWHNYDVYGATDLDTLLPQFLVAKIKGKPHSYDAHEYFAELPEIVNRPMVKWAWKSLERFIVPRTKYAYTVNQSYADLFWASYKVKFELVRNATVLRPIEVPKNKPEKYILYQGAVNVGRGIEEMIQAMPYVDCKLYICGKGDVYQKCVDLVAALGLQDKVRFFGFVAPNDLRQITLQATLGFTFFTKEGISYYLSLANRFFDYFHNAVPQLCVDFPEYRRINEQFEVACLLGNLAPITIAEAVNKLLQNEAYYQRLQQNCLQARTHINWAAQEKNLLAVYKQMD